MSLKRNDRWILLKHNRGQLANQLWLYLSIYSYCIEHKINFYNPSFFEYSRYFPYIPNSSSYSWLQNFNWLMNFLSPIISRRFARQIVLSFYELWANLQILIHKKATIFANSTHVFLDSKQFRSPEKNMVLLSGYLFRNYTGVKKYEALLRDRFCLNMTAMRRMSSQMLRLRARYKNIIGVHIRQKDYKSASWKHLYISPVRANQILDEYLQIAKDDSSDTLFLVFSDEKINGVIFTSKNVVLSRLSAIYDLYLLAMCDVVIGSNSTFGAFSAWHGNIPHIIMTNSKMDWNYYKNRSTFFSNKYLLEKLY